MAGEYVLGACVAAKVLFQEQGSVAARALVGDADKLIGPDFVLLEITNVAVKKVRRKEITRAQAEEALTDLSGLYDRLVPTETLRQAAMDLALGTMASTYDAIYAALAVQEGLTVLTADKRFADSMRGCTGAPMFLVLDAE